MKKGELKRVLETVFPELTGHVVISQLDKTVSFSVEIKDFNRLEQCYDVLQQMNFPGYDYFIQDDHEFFGAEFTQL